ncbi:hypothetical protein Hanom_Chr02g00116561 [Helianthus anomalus]
MESSWIVAIAQAEEVTPPVSQETQVGISSDATTTTVETTISQLDDGYIIKTPLTETTVEAIVSLPVRSPRYQEKGETSSKLGITTSVGNSDDPINLGGGLNYPELMERVTKLETSVGEIRDMMKNLGTKL